MDIYNDAVELELNESEVDEILGLEREREIIEPEEMPEEEEDSFPNIRNPSGRFIEYFPVPSPHTAHETMLYSPVGT